MEPSLTNVNNEKKRSYRKWLKRNHGGLAFNSNPGAQWPNQDLAAHFIWWKNGRRGDEPHFNRSYTKPTGSENPKRMRVQYTKRTVLVEEKINVYQDDTEFEDDSPMFMRILDNEPKLLTDSTSPPAHNVNMAYTPCVMKLCMMMSKAISTGISCACSSRGCPNELNIFCFAGRGTSIRDLELCCEHCAQTSPHAIRRVLNMNKKRALVWLTAAGQSRNMNCPICNLEEKKVDIFDDWHSSHKRANVRAGNQDIENLFPAHIRCNNEMQTRELIELREASGYADQDPFNNGMDEKAAREFLSS